MVEGEFKVQSLEKIDTFNQDQDFGVIRVAGPRLQELGGSKRTGAGFHNSKRTTIEIARPDRADQDDQAGLGNERDRPSV